MAGNQLLDNHQTNFKIPPYLKPGDWIGITSPAGYISEADIAPAIERIEGWGYIAIIGETIGKRDANFGGTDAERLADFQNMLNDEGISAILCARGGYGSIRLIDDLNFTIFKNNPKWIIGFSDITVIHNHIFNKYQIASIHSKMCNSFPPVWEAADAIQQASIESIDACLKGNTIDYAIAPHPQNIPGIAEGRLVGGNLRTLENLSGSASSPDTDGCILFLEETGEYLYSIDRMFYNLQRSEKLSKLAGLIIGGFKTKPDDAGEEFKYSLEEIVLQKTKDFGYPVCFNFPVGHQKNNMALTHGAIHTLHVAPNKISLRLKN